MTDGFIKLHRKFLEWEWIDDETMVYLFIRLLFKANWEDKTWHGITIERGQFVTGRKSLSLELNMSERSLRTRLERLKQTGEISIKTTNQFSIITICKYDSYQSTKKANDQQTTNKRPANDQQTTTTKEHKEVKKERTNSIESTRAKKFVPPALPEVVEYFRQNGYTEESAKKAFNYYKEGGWIDGRGNRVRNWKQKMQSVWFKDENLIYMKPKIITSSPFS